jgi:thiamine kinase-like enzyme
MKPYLGRALQGHCQPTLTHSDVQQKNIMVSVNPGCRNIQGERSFDIMLVDWENAGWYPEYWEYFTASCSIAFHYCEEDWTWRVTQFLQVWPAEMAMMRMVDRDLGMGW